MIKVAVIGAAGRMGRRLVANITDAEGMELSGALEIENSPFIGHDAGVVAGINPLNVKISSSLSDVLNGTDAIIDFSLGDVVATAEAAAKNDTAVVIGTTALGDEGRDKLQKIADKDGGRIVFASNMSVGVNLLFKLCGEVTKILGEDYDIEIVEMHHNQKKDAPSGTAVSIAEVITDGQRALV